MCHTQRFLFNSKLKTIKFPEGGVLSKFDSYLYLLPTESMDSNGKLLMLNCVQNHMQKKD